MVHITHNLHEVEYDFLYEYLKQNEVNVNASRAKRAAKAHDPLAFVANTYASPSHSRSSQAYYMLLAKQDEAGINLDEEHNDFLLAGVPEDEELQELNTSRIMLACIQTVTNDSDAEPSYDSDFMDEVQDSSSSFLEGLFSDYDHEQSHHEQ
nr:hypothetical protein [Tanacetum cinerariifolium]